MPKKTVKKNIKGPEPFPEVNKAKAAFEEYKKRTAASADKMWSKDVKFKQPLTGQPLMQPFMNMPQPPFAAPSGSMSQPFLYNSQAPYIPAGLSGAPLFNSIGSMLRLGVDFINASLAGGLQLMEGFSGGGDCCGSSYTGCSCCSEPVCCCGDASCCEPCSCCNPSVHNCC